MLMWPLKPRRKDRSVAAARQAGRHGAVGPVAGRTSASSAIQRTGRPLALSTGLGSAWNRVRGAGYLDAPLHRRRGRPVGGWGGRCLRLADRDAGRDVDQGEGARVSAEGGGCGLVAGSSTTPPGGNRAGPDDQAHQPSPNAAGTRCPPLAVRLKLAGDNSCAARRQFCAAAESRASWQRIGQLAGVGCLAQEPLNPRAWSAARGLSVSP